MQVAALPPSETLDTLPALAPSNTVTSQRSASLVVTDGARMLALVNTSPGLPWFHMIVAGTMLVRPILDQVATQLGPACTSPTAAARA